MRVRQAIYNRAILPEHRGNPLIEALRPKPTDEELCINLAYYPECNERERKLKAFERVDYLTRLKTLRQPMPIYLECFRAIETAIKDGYSAKNPLSPTTANFLHYPVNKRPNVEPCTGYFNPKGAGMTIIGESGVGKTCMLEQIMGFYDDVIVHSAYEGDILPLKQVVWIKVDCPEDSSVRALCQKILIELDRKLENRPTKPERLIPDLLAQIEARIKSGFLGMLVIDEMQNLDLAKTGGADKLLAFLHNLVNNLGVPLLFCANPPFDKLLEKKWKDARRAESEGYFDVNLMENDEEWELFVNELWSLQWTDVETPITESLSDKLFELSVGNMELAMRIYREAQRLVIGQGDERINEVLLEYAAALAIRATKKSVYKAKRKKHLSILTESKRDKSNTSNTNDIKRNKPELTPHNKQLITIPGDLNRVHHPEFSDAILTVEVCGDLARLIDDPDTIQRVSEQEDPLTALKSEGLLCHDPLEHFS